MSKIEWVNGYTKDGIEHKGMTWNPMTGCTKESDGCKYCYASAILKRFKNGVHKFRNGFTPTFHEDACSIPDTWRKPTFCFVNSMSDTFHRDFQDDVFKVLQTVKRNPKHTFLLLTKRAERMSAMLQGDYISSFNNLWAGVTIESGKYNYRIDELRKLPANIPTFISFEPLLGSVGAVDLTGIDWVIAGCEAGSVKRPMELDWVREIRDACKKSGTAFFFKQKYDNGKKVGRPFLDGRQHDDFPKL